MPARPDKSVNGMMINRTVIEKRGMDAFEDTRRLLRANPQLNLEQLSWPTDSQLDGGDGGVYQGSAQLFTYELLLIRNGPASMNAMVSQLGQCYNWQTAFLRAFKDHFTSLLDVEKWWALQMVHFTGLDPSRYWTLEESRRKLDDVLQTQAQVRSAPNELPLRTELTLQTVIGEWDFTRQRNTLEDKMRTLDILRLRLTPDLVSLAVEYRDVLAGYLRQREKAVFTLPGAKPPALTVKGVVRDTLKQLDALDERRMALKFAPKLAGVAGN